MQTPQAIFLHTNRTIIFLDGGNEGKDLGHIRVGGDTTGQENAMRFVTSTVFGGFKGGPRHDIWGRPSFTHRGLRRFIIGYRISYARPNHGNCSQSTITSVSGVERTIQILKRRKVSPRSVFSDSIHFPHTQQWTTTGRPETCLAVTNSSSPDGWGASKKIYCSAGNTSVTLPMKSC